MIKVSVKGGQVFEGTVTAVDPVTNSLVLKLKEGSFVLFSPSQISGIEGDISQYRSLDVAEYGINLGSLEKHERKALENAERMISALNSGVSPEIQSLFDRLNFIFPCKWDGVSMVVLEEFIIDPPYEKVVSDGRLAEGTSGVGLERVVKVLTGERLKLGLDTPQPK